MAAISRRALLSSAAAVPLAVSVGVQADAAAPLSAPAAVAPAKPFQWWISFDDGDVFVDWFDTKEDALKALAANGEGMIAECQRQDFDLWIDADQILELWADNNAELIGEGEFVSVTNEQANELSKLLTAVAYDWARRHNLDLEAWMFGKVRNRIKASDLPLPSPESNYE